MVCVCASLLFALALFVQPQYAACLDLTWLPSDPYGPLPMSKRFLDKLHRLCQVKKLPPTVSAADEHKLGIMCQQLRDSSYVPNGLDGVDYSDHASSTPGIIFSVVVLALLAYQFYFKDLLSNRRRAGGVGGGHRLGGAGSSASATNSVQSEEAREVLRQRRLERLARSKVNTKPLPNPWASQ